MRSEEEVNNIFFAYPVSRIVITYELLDEEELYVRREEEVNNIFFAYQVSSSVAEPVHF